MSFSLENVVSGRSDADAQRHFAALTGTQVPGLFDESPYC